MILLVGADGNMGSRYKAILRFLGKPWKGVDVTHSEKYVMQNAYAAEGILIATPTDTHTQLVRKFMHLKKPILCEKPITKDMRDFRDLMAELQDHKTPFRMVNQYRVLAGDSRMGKSFYDYFKHGKDGLYWDCLQIIGLARGEIRISEESPVWRCMINGKPINLAHMDAAYIKYIQEWLQTPAQDLSQIIEAHEKTAELERIYKNGELPKHPDLHPSAN